MLTVPNALGLIYMSMALNEGCENINSDHKYWFTPYTIQKVLYSAGYETEEIIMCTYHSNLEYLQPYHNQLCQKPVLLDDILIICK